MGEGQCDAGVKIVTSVGWQPTRDHCCFGIHCGSHSLKSRACFPIRLNGCDLPSKGIALSLDDIRLLLAFTFAVVTLVVLISRFSLAPFVSLIIASIILALTAGLELSEAWDQFASGVGSVLGSTAMIIGLGAMTGALLHRSGGATALAQRMVEIMGVKRLDWAMLLVGLLVGIGVWFTVGLVLLVPIAVSLARVARVSILLPAMSMLAGLSAMHGLAPPHPGPLVAIVLLEADTGKTILWSLLIGPIAAALAGPMLWRWFEGKIEMPTTEPLSEEERGASDETTRIGTLAPLSVIALPIILMLAGSFVDAEKMVVLHALGTPTMALLLGLILAYFVLGIRCGMSLKGIAKLTEESLHPVANVLLVVGAGAGFSKVLIASGVGITLGKLAVQVPVSTMVMAWLVAAAFRVTTGSATTAITAAGGILSEMVSNDHAINRELLVLALGAGSLVLSHVNDGGFWFVKELFSLTVKQTLQTWTVLETVLSIVALAVILLLDSLV
jgi:GntP family gluconate:H+ symporter